MSEKIDTIKDRAKVAWKAFSVQALVILASFQLWWPALEAALRGALGDNADSIVQTVIALAGILGWIKPQASLTKRK